MTALQEFIAGRAIDVDVRAIEKELASLWRAAAKRDHAAVRAALWNLVVYTESDDAHARAEGALDAFALHCPARIVMLRRRENGAELAAKVSAKCHPASGGAKVVGSEEIILEAGAHGSQHLPSLARALLLPDLPSALFWAAELPTDPGELWRFLPGTDRLVVDTGALDDPRALRRLGELADASPDVELADLGWMRGASTRQLLASFFDPPVGARPLYGMKRLEITYGRGGRTAALLLVGWLSACLGWSERGAPIVELAPQDVDAGEDGIFEIAIEGSEGSRYSITDAGVDKHLLRGTSLPARVLAAPVQETSALLVDALGMRGKDPMFRRALERAAQWEVGR
jgi:glucose-6-phosphate dehydrogenase assembly protein OpcA